MDKRFEQTAFFPAEILLPQTEEMEKWAVVACDQFTSQPEYWQKAEELVGDAPSALRLVLPEAYLNGADVDSRIAAINAAMERYLADGVFRTLPDSLIYLERTQSDGRVRRGLMGCIDLEQYDFTPGSGALIRATEGTVLELHPPRVPGAGARPFGAAPRDAADRRPQGDGHPALARGDRHHGRPV